MEFSISTPAILFSAISLFMLAFTNRFLALSNLIRTQMAKYKENKNENILKQIKNLLFRLKIIKYTQVFSALSFLFCVMSMFIIFINKVKPAEIIFALSLISLFVSLILSLSEIFLSFGALKHEIEGI